MIGTRIGPYEILAKVGEGGMARSIVRATRAAAVAPGDRELAGAAEAATASKLAALIGCGRCRVRLQVGTDDAQGAMTRSFGK